MDHILNKVDDILRNKVNEITKDGKIHSVKENKITTDNDNKSENKNNTKTSKQAYIVQAKKSEKFEVDAYETEEKNKTLGKFLDVKE
ncbi:MAG: hypothetical protein AB6733_05840 [Clostridiaceae bacterium]